MQTQWRPALIKKNILEQLPVELLASIFFYIRDDVSNVTITLVSKYIGNLSDELIWKAKCVEKEFDLNLKEPNSSWKAYYHYSDVHPFPIRGFLPGMTVEQLIEKHPNAIPRKSGTGGRVLIKGVYFWYESKIFKIDVDTEFNQGQDTKQIPRQWIKSGFAWTTTPVISCLNMLKIWPGNFDCTFQRHDNHKTVSFTSTVRYLIDIWYSINMTYLAKNIKEFRLASFQIRFIDDFPGATEEDKQADRDQYIHKKQVFWTNSDLWSQNYSTSEEKFLEFLEINNEVENKNTYGRQVKAIFYN